MKSLHSKKKQFRFGSFTYKYELIQQDRKTLALTITPQLNISVKAPYSADIKRIELFLKRKWRWLQEQINFFKKFQMKSYTKEYISGESINYLGRQFKLLIKENKHDDIILQKKIFLVHTSKSKNNTEYIKRLISIWYDKKVQEVFSERFEVIKAKFGYRHEIKLSYKDIKNKWGIFHHKNDVILNPRLIYVSKAGIDYVITHELNHIKYKNHDKKFYQSLDKILPKWKKIKDRLEEQGAQIKY
jgi:predicted metal-dependent hydrolase